MAGHTNSLLYTEGKMDGDDAGKEQKLRKYYVYKNITQK